MTLFGTAFNMKINKNDIWWLNCGGALKKANKADN